MKPHCFSFRSLLRSWGNGLVVLLAVALCAVQTQAKDYAVEQQRIEQFFPKATHISEPEGEYQVRTLADGVGTVYGYAY